MPAFRSWFLVTLGPTSWLPFYPSSSSLRAVVSPPSLVSTIDRYALWLCGEIESTCEGVRHVCPYTRSFLSKPASTDDPPSPIGLAHRAFSSWSRYSGSTAKPNKTYHHFLMQAPEIAFHLVGGDRLLQDDV